MDLLSVLKLVNPFSSSSASMNLMSADSKRAVRARLKFIGNLSKGDKLDSHNLAIESSSFWTGLKRLFVTGDSRQTMLSFLSQTIERSCELIDANKHSKDVSDQIFCANVIQDLVNSVKGLKAVQQTYKDDKFFPCEIDVLIETITAKLFSVQKSQPHLFTIKDLCVFELSDGKTSSEGDDHPLQIKVPPRPLHTEEDDDETP